MGVKSKVLLKTWSILLHFFTSELMVHFLGTVDNRDDESLKRYAVVYKECNRIKVPTRFGSRTWQKMVPKANTITMIQIKVKIWALSLLLSWPIVLQLMVMFVGWRIKGRNLRHHVYGEEQIAKHWYSEVQR
ncbi:hypothetical protein BWQ96_00814 [Gracilariopsis chorda]|uniref:Transmembrane protein n=1 Tax=Gracilariopsis chorda TaxID=448386 RepID=A0A2V3J4Y5_9FLOR|nr:hypothetical protein BWQ96_00814 [Gracilariopsis chorda]|eukprot:PXF49498.1 hypothetical protein BWQ96_00814 [Gracilariopsis chorda]